MTTADDLRVDLARYVLEGIRLKHFIGDDGRPTQECWKRLEERTLSSGERTLVSIALGIVDFVPFDPPPVNRLLLLDRESLGRVAVALARLASEG